MPLQGTFQSRPVAGPILVVLFAGLQQDDSSSYVGGIEGRFIGTDADGALVAFEVREIEGEHRVVGSRILERAE